MSRFNFVTLFDKNYLSRGLALYSSLLEHCKGFFIYILAMDTETEDFFKKETSDNRSIISLNEIESFYPELKEIKKERTRAEYCWTLTPYSVQYTINKYKLNSCTYIDADIFFFNDPKILFDEAGDNSIIITEHRYTPECDQTEKSGKYCVQFTFFKNDMFGIEALEWWKQRCKEWCYAKIEDGKFGDQKYLDDWTTRFKQVYVPTHIGCGLAPWNIQQYNVSLSNGILYAQDKITKNKQPVVFFHFHILKKIYANTDKIVWQLNNSYDYRLEDQDIKLLYAGYLNILSKYDTSVDVLAKMKKPAFFMLLKIFIKDIVKTFFIFKKIKKIKKCLIDRYKQKKKKIITVYLKNI